MQYVSSGPRHLCCCASGFVTLHQEPGENPSHARGYETCSGVSSTSGVWILVGGMFLFPKIKPLTLGAYMSLYFTLLVITKQHKAHSVRLCKMCVLSEYAHVCLNSYCAIVLLFSFLSQTGKCIAAVRVALVQCLVALLEVSSQRSSHVCSL